MDEVQRIKRHALRHWRVPFPRRDAMPVMQQVPDTHPLMIAWKAYRSTEDATNSEKWARTHPEESLWAAFMAGFNAATERSASLHENVNPASDDERHNKVPGAGAMGAVIEYRDLIRAPQ